MHQLIYSIHFIWHTVQHANFYYLFEKFPSGGSFLTGVCKFDLNYFCIGVVTTNSWAPGEVIMWFFSWCFKWLSIIIKNNIRNWILIIFWTVWRLFFSCVSRFLVYSSSGSRWCCDSRWLVKCRINLFLIFVLKKLNWYRDCKNIINHARSLSFLFSKFVHIGMSNIVCQMLKWWDLGDNIDFF